MRWLRLAHFLFSVEKDRENKFFNNSKPLDVNYSIGTSATRIKKQASDDLPSVASRNETLRKAQAQLAMAHEKYQQYIQNKYQGTKKPKTIDVDILKKSIALNQYQKSTQNPYKNQEVIKMNKVFTSDISQNSNISQNSKYQIPPRPKMEKKPEFTSPYIQRKTNVIKQNPAQNPPSAEAAHPPTIPRQMGTDT